MNSNENWELIKAFQEKNPTKEEKEKALQKMTNEEIDVLINSSGNIYAKIFYSKFKNEGNS